MYIDVMYSMCLAVHAFALPAPICLYYLSIPLQQTRHYAYPVATTVKNSYGAFWRIYSASLVPP